jgi:hypothetical protein
VGEAKLSSIIFSGMHLDTVGFDKTFHCERYCGSAINCCLKLVLTWYLQMKYCLRQLFILALNDWIFTVLAFG